MEDDYSYTYVLDGSRLSLDGEVFTVAMTENTLKLIDEDYNSRMFYRLEGSNYPTPGECTNDVIYRGLRYELPESFDTSSESVFIDSGAEVNGVSYARFRSKLYANYKYVSRYTAYDVVCLWSGAVGRWFFRSGEPDVTEAGILLWNLDDTVWEGDNIRVQILSVNNEEIDCLWTLDGISNKRTYKLSNDAEYSYAWLSDDYNLYLFRDDRLFFGRDMVHGQWLTQIG